VIDFLPPKMDIDKYESRRILVEIRRVLLQTWDPIGIRDEPKAQDEYDTYLGGVYALLVGGATDEEISNHLWHIVNDRMGLNAARKAMEETVAALRAIRIPRSPAP
jgi:hypothetical protein